MNMVVRGQKIGNSKKHPSKLMCLRVPCSFGPACVMLAFLLFLYWLGPESSFGGSLPHVRAESQFGFLFGLTNVCWLGPGPPRCADPMYPVCTVEQGYASLFEQFIYTVSKANFSPFLPIFRCLYVNEEA
jgi:hypothetical protein